MTEEEKKELSQWQTTAMAEIMGLRRDLDRLNRAVFRQGAFARPLNQAGKIR